MRRLLSFGIVMLAVSSVVCSAADRKSYGDGVSEGARTPISEILAQPEAFAGKVVRVEGRVSDVCRKAGCWMDVADDAGARIQIKVKDGVIVFPVGAVGKSAVAEGKVEVLDLSRDSYVAWLKHMAEENGREFDPDSIGEAPYRIVRLRGLGATIEE